jgi:hypothetical protein
MAGAVSTGSPQCLIKGDSPVTRANIERVVDKAADMLGDARPGNPSHASPLT